MFQVGYQILKSLFPFRRMYFIAPVVGYALRRKSDSWARVSAGSRPRSCRYIEGRTSRFERRVDGIRRLLLPLSKLQLRFLFDRVSEGKWNLEQSDEEIHYRKVGNFLFLLFRAFWHGRGCGSSVLRSRPAQRSARSAAATKQQTTDG